MSVVPFVALGTILSFSVMPTLGLATSTNEVLNQLPDRKITLDLIIGYALKSNGFKATISNGANSEVVKLKAESPLDWKLTAKWLTVRDLTKPQSLLSPEEVDSQSLSLGVGKYFRTGTTFSVEWLNKKIDTNFSSNSTGNPVFDSLLRDRSEYTPEINISLRQDLWKNSFGSATRNQLEAASLQKSSQLIQFKESLKDWYFDLLKTYYSAWLAQEQVRQADADYQRQLRLFRVSEARHRHGNTELADFLQVKVGLNLAQQRLEGSKQKLFSLWRDIVYQLELPTTWLEINAVDLPVVLDEPIAEAVKYCSENFDGQKHALLEQARTDKLAASSQALAASQKLAPDLYLFANLKSGSRASSYDSAVSQVKKGEYPTTTYGVQLDWFIDSSAEKAQWIEARSAELRTQAFYGLKESSLKSTWIGQCENLKRLVQFNEQLVIARKDQLQRLDLEEKRFREGRSLLFQVIQAQGDLQNTLNLESQNASELRLSAWQVVRYSNEFEAKFDRIVGSTLRAE